MEEITFGPYAAPVILTVVLGVIYKFINFSDRWKVGIAVLCGIGLGFLAIAYQGLQWTVVTIVDYAIYGLMLGASSIGLHQLQKQARKPKPEIK
jgi:hypothetical protein